MLFEFLSCFFISFFIKNFFVHRHLQNVLVPFKKLMYKIKRKLAVSFYLEQTESSLKASNIEDFFYLGNVPFHTLLASL